MVDTSGVTTNGLIVDDSVTVRRLLGRILTELGIAPREAADGQAALEACRAALPDFILLDWNMPVMDGLSFVKQFRSMPGNERVKVIFCTTENDVAKISDALTAGANEYIMKPFTTEIVRSKLEQVGVPCR